MAGRRGNRGPDGTTEPCSTSRGPAPSGPLSLDVEATLRSVNCYLYQYLITTIPWYLTSQFLHLCMEVMTPASDDYCNNQTRQRTQAVWCSVTVCPSYRIFWGFQKNETQPKQDTSKKQEKGLKTTSDLSNSGTWMNLLMKRH